MKHLAETPTLIRSTDDRDAATQLRTPASVEPSLEDVAAGTLDLIVRHVKAAARAACFVSQGVNDVRALARRQRRPGGTTFSTAKNAVHRALRSGVRDVRPLGEPARRMYAITVPVTNGPDLAVAVQVEVEGVSPAEVASVAERITAIAATQRQAFVVASAASAVHVWVDGLLRTLTAVLDAKDTYTAGHSERVTRFSLAIGSMIGLDGAERRALASSAASHDIGKIGVRDEVLKKPGLLSNDEFAEMRAHPLVGARIAENTPIHGEIIDGIRSHHERWDGTGYPDGLVGEAIPLFARVIAVADAFDAMTSGRTYSGFTEQADAVAQLVEKDDLFDPEILKAFEKAYNEGVLTMRTGTVASPK